MDRTLLNKQQTALRRVMLESADHAQAIELFLHQHALLHAATMSGLGLWSYEDVILDGLDERQMRRIPRNEEHSIVWCLWHIARIEDVTMNLLVDKTDPLFEEENWGVKLKTPIIHTANAMTEADVDEFSQQIDIATLRAYRIAVGRRTREIASRLEPGTLHERVDQAQIARVAEQSLVHPDAQDVIDYWSKRTIAGLLLMPASRHLLVHLNEAARLKKRKS